MCRLVEVSVVVVVVVVVTFFVCLRLRRIAVTLCRRRCFPLCVGSVVLVRLVCVLVVYQCRGVLCLR